MISFLCLFLPPVPVVRLKVELFSSLGVGMLSGSFFPFRSSRSFPLLSFFSFSLSIFSSASSSSPSSFLTSPGIFPSLAGYVLPGISHIHHVITVIFSALRHVALPFLFFDSFEARTRGREIRKEFISRDNVFSEKISNCNYSSVLQS